MSPTIRIGTSVLREIFATILPLVLPLGRLLFTMSILQRPLLRGLCCSESWGCVPTLITTSDPTGAFVFLWEHRTLPPIIPKRRGHQIPKIASKPFRFVSLLRSGLRSYCTSSPLFLPFVLWGSLSRNIPSTSRGLICFLQKIYPQGSRKGEIA